MANWTNLSGSFTFGSKLTSVQMQNLRDNITAAFEGASGSPGDAQLFLSIDSMVDSSQLNKYNIVNSGTVLMVKTTTETRIGSDTWGTANIDHRAYCIGGTYIYKWYHSVNPIGGTTHTIYIVKNTNSYYYYSTTDSLAYSLVSVVVSTSPGDTIRLAIYVSNSTGATTSINSFTIEGDENIKNILLPWSRVASRQFTYATWE